MRVILFGATGMIGQGALKECLRDPKVEQVLAVVRRSTGLKHDRLQEVVHNDFFDFSPLVSRFKTFDACLFCLGVSSAGMSEGDYERTTYGITMAAANALGRARPGIRFLYISGAGTDSTEKGRSMWARVKGKTENALLRHPGVDAYMFRPGFIQPLDGIRSSTRLYRVLYAASRPVFPALRLMFRNSIITTRELGQAMLEIASRGHGKRVLEAKDIAAVARAS